ncbi:MAG: hypothetical protein ACKPKO_56010, partial [Candidatus Fonsibacter sp.]
YGDIANDENYRKLYYQRERQNKNSERINEPRKTRGRKKTITDKNEYHKRYYHKKVRDKINAKRIEENKPPMKNGNRKYEDGQVVYYTMKRIIRYPTVKKKDFSLEAQD